MRIVGVDLGPEFSAYTYLDGTAIVTHEYCHNRSLLETLRAGFPHAIVALESPQAQDRPLGKMLRDTIILAGRVIEVLETRSISYKEVDERDVALWLTGNRSATNAAVRQSLLDRYGDKSQQPCADCRSTGKVQGVRGPKKCPACKGEKFIRVPGPLSGMNEHERSALAAATYVSEMQARKREAV